MNSDEKDQVDPGHSEGRKQHRLKGGDKDLVCCGQEMKRLNEEAAKAY